MIELRVIKPEGFSYGLAPLRKHYAKGDIFVARERDVDLLVRARMAVRVDAENYQTREVKAEEAPTKKARGRPRKVVSGEDPEKEPIKRRTYKRRDMKAEK